MIKIHPSQFIAILCTAILISASINDSYADSSMHRNELFGEKFEVDLETLVFHNGWSLPTDAEVLMGEGRDGESPYMRIKQEVTSDNYANVAVPSKGAEQYIVTVMVRTGSGGTNGQGTIRLRFLNEGGSVLREFVRPGVINTGGNWESIEIELPFLSPENTARMDVGLGIKGRGTVDYGDLKVYGLRPEFNNLIPVDGSSVNLVRPEFSWEAHFGRYRLELSQSKDFSEGVKYVYTRGNSVRPLEGLDAGVWYWRVRPWRPDRVGFTGGASTIQSIRVANGAAFWPPHVESRAHWWAEGPRREFEILVEPFDASYSVEVLLAGEAAELVGRDGSILTFRPSVALDPGLHDLTVTVRNSSGTESVQVEGFLNNVIPGNRSRINAKGIMEVDGNPFFPIGAYRDPSNRIEEFSGVVEADWNIIFSYFSASNRSNADALLNGALENGVKVLMRHPAGWGHDDDFSLRLARWIAEYSQHPALVAWYVGDEPELYGHTLECVDRQIEIIRKTDPNSVTTMVSHHINSYGRRGDVFMPMNYVLGPYFGHSAEIPMDARTINTMRSQGLANLRERWELQDGEIRPIWTILQSFDPRSRDYARNREEAIQRYGRPLRPTYEEHRCMIFSALAYDVQGIFFWFFGGGRQYSMLEDALEKWEGLAMASIELRSLESYLVVPKSAEDELEVPEPLLVWTREHDGTRVLALINPLINSVRVKVDFGKYNISQLNVRDTGEVVILDNGLLDTTLASYEVRVFEWPTNR